MAERLSQAVRTGLRVGGLAALICAGGIVLTLLSGEGNDLAWGIITVPAFLVAISIIAFGLAYAFPAPGGQVAFPGARKVIWPFVALLALATAFVRQC